jgi:uncharacterized membrane protein
MDNIEQTEIKKEFQLERVILFSDAVFAIIITIMVLDIRLPEGLRHADASQIKRAFAQLIPKFFGYGISFLLVSKFWRNHLKMFSLLKDYDRKLLAYNLFYLFSISFFPFAVSLSSGNLDLESQQFAWAGYTYVGIFLLCTFSQTLLATYLIKNRQQLCFDVDNLDKILKYKALRLNFFTIPLVIIAMFGLNYFQAKPYFAVSVLAIYIMIMGRLAKRYYPEKSNNGPILSRLFRKRKFIFAKPQLVREEIGNQ